MKVFVLSNLYVPYTNMFLQHPQHYFITLNISSCANSLLKKQLTDDSICFSLFMSDDEQLFTSLTSVSFNSMFTAAAHFSIGFLKIYGSKYLNRPSYSTLRLTATRKILQSLTYPGPQRQVSKQWLGTQSQCQVIAEVDMKTMQVK